MPQRGSPYVHIGRSSLTQLTKNISVNLSGSSHLLKFDIFENTVKKQINTYLEECIPGVFAILRQYVIHIDLVTLP